MKLALTSVSLIVAVTVAAAQQPNSAEATLVIGTSGYGPPYPLITSHRGSQIDWNVTGGPGEVFALFHAPRVALTPGRLPPTVFGRVDLDPAAPPVAVLNGFQPTSLFDRLARLGGRGAFWLSTSVAGPGDLGAWQAVVSSPSSPGGARLTAAHAVEVFPYTTFWAAVADDVSLALPLFNGSTSFYGTTYSELNITDNGIIRFQDGWLTPAADPSPSALEFDTGFPAIAGCWTDLLPATASGFVTIQVEDGHDGWAVHTSGFGVPLALGSKAIDPAFDPLGSGFTVRYFDTAAHPMNTTGHDHVIRIESRVDPLWAAQNLGRSSVTLPAATGLLGITPGGTVPAVPSIPTLSAPLASEVHDIDLATDPLYAGGAGIDARSAMTAYRAWYPTPALGLRSILATPGFALTFIPRLGSTRYDLR